MANEELTKTLLEALKEAIALRDLLRKEIKRLRAKRQAKCGHNATRKKARK